jgi:hypothetical protein
MAIRATRTAIMAALAVTASFLTGCVTKPPEVGTATIVVQSPDGTPREGCDAQFTGDAPLTEEGRSTNADGRVEVTAAPGSYTVVIRCGSDEASKEFSISSTGPAIEVSVVM